LHGCIGVSPTPSFEERSVPRLTIPLLLLLGSCAMSPAGPELTACLSRMEGHVTRLMPAFAALGYRSDVHLRLDEDLSDGRGFRSSASTLGDSSSSGSVRLRPSRVCTNDVLASAVVAHEMAHVALQHRGMAGTGITLLWEKPPRQEAEANELAYAVLTRAGGEADAATLVGCWLGRCGGNALPGTDSRHR
jgi:hypothetical protein